MIPENCNACGKPLLLANLFVDDGCPCNSPRGANFQPRTCVLCGTDDCVKPAHHIREIDLRARLAEAVKALRWALGENGEFRERAPGEGAYWWRKEMRDRARTLLSTVDGGGK